MFPARLSFSTLPEEPPLNDPSILYQSLPEAAGSSGRSYGYTPTFRAPPLVLIKLSLASPLCLEAIGAWLQLDVIRKYVVDRHERKKDHQYRNAAEEEKLDLENTLLKMKVMQEAIEVAPQAGLSEEEIEEQARHMLGGALRRLQSSANRVGATEVRVLDIETPSADKSIERAELVHSGKTLTLGDGQSQ